MIAIVDYGLGNIKAFANVYKKLNVSYCFARTPEQLTNADKIILPGVGSFDHAMTKLNGSGLRECLENLILEQGVPVLGVCVGMQIMANSSEEGELQGLGWIPGKVKKFSFDNAGMQDKYPLPHMGWNNLILGKQDHICNGLSEIPTFYFLHSYYFECLDDEFSLASADYGFDFSCIVKRNNIYGIQCHPEKSHGNGVTILKNFSDI